MSFPMNKSNQRMLGLTVAILCAIPFSVSQAAAKKHETTKSQASDEQILRQQAQDYATAFSVCDSNALAGMWSPNGSFVDMNGQEYRGRTDIQLMFDKLFKQIGKQPLIIKVDSIRFPAPGVAIEEGTSEISKGAAPFAAGRYTVTHVKTDGHWYMEVASESPERSVDLSTPENKLPRLTWLLGNWTSGAAHLHVDWMPNHDKTFMTCNFTFDPSAAGKGRSDDMQVFGWNPRSAQVNVWHYAADGGFGYGRMINTDAQTWIERANSMSPDGTVSSADYVFKKLDDNSFTWQSIHRSHGHTTLPDLPLVTVQRDGSAPK